jgi:hypothetical protein
MPSPQIQTARTTLEPCPEPCSSKVSITAVYADITDIKARDGLAAMDKLMRQTVTESERPLMDANLPSSPGRVTATAV